MTFIQPTLASKILSQHLFPVIVSELHKVWENVCTWVGHAGCKVLAFPFEARKEPSSASRSILGRIGKD